MFFVESSGRFSPGTSPNVSTSGRPVSETSSVENPDLDIVKQEHPDPGEGVEIISKAFNTEFNSFGVNFLYPYTEYVFNFEVY